MNKNQDLNLYVLTGKEKENEISEHIRQKIATYNVQNNDTYRSWLLSTSFSRGQQRGNLHNKENRIVNLMPPVGRQYVTEDMIGPWKRHMVANLSLTQPIWEAVPKNIAYDSIMAARTANDILSAYWDEWRFIEKDIALSSYLVDFCNALIFIRYNEDEGEEQVIYNSETGEPIIDEKSGNPFKQLLKTGKISADIAPPHHLGCPLDPSDLDEKPWIYWWQARPVSWFKQRYGELGENIVPENIKGASQYSLSYLSRGSDRASQGEQTANEVFYMQKPCDECPDGLVIPYANEKLLATDRDKWRWQFEQMKEYPVIHVHGEKCPGEFWSRSSIEQQIPLQRMLNLIRSCMADNIDNMAHMKWFVPATAGVSSIWDVNEIVTYEGQQPPIMGEVKPLPNWITEERNSLKQAIRDIQSYHGASMGGAESGVRSDIHAQNLQDQDLLPLSTIDNLKGAGYARMGEKILRIQAEKMSEQSMSFVSDGRPIVIKNFQTAMMDNISRVNVKMTNGRLRNKAMTKQEIYQWFGAQMITDPITGQPDAYEAMKLLEFALPESYFNGYRVHSNQAYSENMRMLDGEAPVPYPWQNHIIHMKTHREEMNSPRFMQLLESAENNDGDAKKVADLFVAHIQKTADLMMGALPKTPPEGSETQERTSQTREPEKTSNTGQSGQKR